MELGNNTVKTLGGYSIIHNKILMEIGEIKKCNEFKYLGVKISNNKDVFKNHLTEKLKNIDKYKYWMTYLLKGRKEKILLGKTIWKNVMLPKIMHGSSAIITSKKFNDKLNKTQNSIFKSILGLPTYAPEEYIRGEVGLSSQNWRDVKCKILMLKHIMNNTNKLKRMIIEEWETGIIDWIEDCKLKLNKIDMTVEELTSEKTTGVLKRINKYDNEEWNRTGRKKGSLKWYFESRFTIGGRKLLTTENGSYITRRWICGAVLLNAKIGKDTQEKLCLKCNVEENMEHVMKNCERYRDLRKKYKIEQQTKMEIILGIEDYKMYEKYRIELYEQFKCRTTTMK